MARTKAFQEDEVVEKAMRYFWQFGYVQTSMQDLVDTMGINRRSMYDTFGDKADLFQRCLALYATQFIDKVHQRVDQQSSLQGQLNALMTTNLNDTDVHPRGCLVVNATTVDWSSSSEIMNKVNQFLHQGEVYISELIQAAVRRGEFNATEAEIGELAASLNNTWVGVRLNARLTTDVEKLHRIVATSLQILAQGAK